MILSKNVSRIDVYDVASARESDRDRDTLVATLQIVTRWGKRRGTLTVHLPQFDSVVRKTLMEPTLVMSGGRHGDTFVDMLTTLPPFSDEAIAHALEYGLRNHGLRGVKHSWSS